MWIELVAIAGAVALGGQAPEAPIVELERVVHCGLAWQVSVYVSGAAHQRVEDTCGGRPASSQQYELSPAEIESLQRAIREAEPASLPEEIRAEAVYPDEVLLVMTVPAGDRRHRIRARGIERARSEEAERFLRVWRAVTELVPEPSSENGRR